MTRMQLPLLRRAALVVAAGCVALTAFSGAALAQPDPAPPEPETEQSEPAPAGPGLCPDGSLCVWPKRDYMGSVTEMSGPASGCQTLSKPAMSAVNDSSSTAVFYDAAGCLGQVVIGVEPGRKAPHFPSAASVRLRVPAPPGAGPVAGEPTSGTADPAP